MPIIIPDNVLTSIMSDISKISFHIDHKLVKYTNKFFNILFNVNNEISNNTENFILAYLFGEQYGNKIILDYLHIKNINNIKILEYDGNKCMLNKYNYNDGNICCIDCNNCNECSFCINCKDCDNCCRCIHLSDSKFCNYSNELINCNFCNYCDNCTDCTFNNKCSKCINCSYCDLINNSIKCINCSSSDKLYNCYNSSNCENLTNCDRCTICTNGILLNQCTKVNKSYACNNCYKCENLYKGREINNVDGSNILYYSDHDYETMKIDNIYIKYNKYKNNIAYGIFTKDNKDIYKGSFIIKDNSIFLIYGKLNIDNAVYHGLIGRELKNGKLVPSRLSIIYGSEISDNTIVNNINHFTM